MLKITVQKQDTLKNILKDNLKDSSGKTIKNYITHSCVTVNGKVVTNASKKLNIGDMVTVNFKKEEKVNFDIKVIYEDKDIIVIDKPAGLLSISNNLEKEITAFRLTSNYIKQKDKNAKLFVVHRLDQETSGVLLFSKNLKLKEELQKNWSDLAVLREYVCVVPTKVPEKGQIKSYLTSNHFQKVYSTKSKTIGKLAITNYNLIKYQNGKSLLKVDIETGRRNQIRVHMSENFAPIIGDKKYGSIVNPINRLALHASKLYITDPGSKKVLKFESPVPKEIVNLL